MRMHAARQGGGSARAAGREPNLLAERAPLDLARGAPGSSNVTFTDGAMGRKACCPLVGS